MKKFGIYTLDDTDVFGKTVLERVDINEPIDRERDCVLDDTRIRGCVPTVRELQKRRKGGFIGTSGQRLRYMSEEQTLFERTVCLSQEQQADMQAAAARWTVRRTRSRTAAPSWRAAAAQTRRLSAGRGALPQTRHTQSNQQEAPTYGQPARPCVFILGGAKIADAFMMLQTILQRGTADTVLTGGLVANIFLAAANTNYWQRIPRLS